MSHREGLYLEYSLKFEFKGKEFYSTECDSSRCSFCWKSIDGICFQHESEFICWTCSKEYFSEVTKERLKAPVKFGDEECFPFRTLEVVFTHENLLLETMGSIFYVTKDQI